MHQQKASSLREILNRRGVDHFIHCTPIENLRSILEHGIIARRDLKESHIIHGQITDSHRFDENEEASCFSVQDVNLSHLRRIQKTGEAAVIVVSKKIILDFKCAFYPRNASKRDFKYKSLNYWQWFERFEEIFTHDEKERLLKDGTFLAPNLPTYSDAEVQVFANIPKKYIEQVAIRKSYRRGDFKTAYPQVKFIDFLDEWSRL